jgi:ribonuclease HI
MAKIEGWFDAATEPVNPCGHIGWGALLKIDGKVAWTGSGYYPAGPETSNNVGEYAACLGLLSEIRSRQEAGLDGPVTIRGDSKLVIMQLQGRWRVRGGFYVPMYREAARMLGMVSALCGGHVRLEWIPRERNSECDVISKGELHKRGIRFRIQPEAPPPTAKREEWSRPAAYMKGVV